MKISIKLTEKSIEQAISEIENYKQKLKKIANEIAKELADVGYQVAYSIMGTADFEKDISSSLQVKREAENKYVLVSNSKEILFFEFGAGAKYGYGHPLNADFGMGPGTYPNGKGHWNDPDGWWFPTDNPNLIRHTDKSGQGWGHSYGNQPYMPFYKADKEMCAKLKQIAEEVFARNV